MAALRMLRNLLMKGRPLQGIPAIHSVGICCRYGHNLYDLAKLGLMRALCRLRRFAWIPGTATIFRFDARPGAT